MTNLDKKIAIVGAGPAGAIALEVFLEYGFRNVQVFERRGLPGGSWVNDHQLGGVVPNPDVALYPGLETNILPELMSFSTKKIKRESSDFEYSSQSRQKYGTEEAFVPASTIFSYVQSFFSGARSDMVRYNTKVEKIEQLSGPGSKWHLTVSSASAPLEFDFVYVSVGRYSKPRIPAELNFDGLPSGVFIHTKSYRYPDDFEGKRVLLIGGSVSVADILHLIKDRALEIYVSFTGVQSIFIDAFSQPFVKPKGLVQSFESGTTSSTVKAVFKDGSRIDNIQKVICGTGYELDLRFLESYTSKYGGIVAGNALKNVYLLTWWSEDPTLAISGYITDGLTWKAMEYQARATAQLWSTPRGFSKAQSQSWERLRRQRNPLDWHSWSPHFDAFFNDILEVGWYKNDVNRPLDYDPAWMEMYLKGFELKRHFWLKVRDQWLRDHPETREQYIATSEYVNSVIQPLPGEYRNS